MGRHTAVEDRRRLVAIWRASGDAMTAFARSHGVLPSTFRSWVQREVAADLADVSGTTFLEVVAAPSAEEPGGFMVDVDGRELRFHAPPPPAWFAAVLSGLGRC